MCTVLRQILQVGMLLIQALRRELGYNEIYIVEFLKPRLPKIQNERCEWNQVPWCPMAYWRESYSSHHASRFAMSNVQERCRVQSCLFSKTA